MFVWFLPNWILSLFSLTIFTDAKFVFFSDALSFLYGAISESVYSNFTVIPFLCYIDSTQQFLEVTFLS